MRNHPRGALKDNGSTDDFEQQMLAMEAVLARYLELRQEPLASPSLLRDVNLRSTLPANGGVYGILERRADWRGSFCVGRSGNLREHIYSSRFVGNGRALTLKRKLIEHGGYADESTVRRYSEEKCLVQFLVAHEGGRTCF